MAAGATIHQFEIALSDVDRSVYETLNLRVAQRPVKKQWSGSSCGFSPTASPTKRRNSLRQEGIG